MASAYFEAGGPLMYGVLAAWVVVLAGVLDRCLYVVGTGLRRPLLRIEALAASGRPDEARRRLALERERATRGLARIEATSQLATSIGLFGTVVGIARSFFARGAGAGLAAPEELATGLSTALFTTIAGLVVFLFGQAFLIAFREWRSFCERSARLALELPGEAVA